MQHHMPYVMHTQAGNELSHREEDTCTHRNMDTHTDMDITDTHMYIRTAHMT